MNLFYRGLIFCLSFFSLALMVVQFSHAALADEVSMMESEFEACRSNLRERALSQGYSNFITEDIIAGLAPLERVISLDRKQPEFTESFGAYIQKRVNDYRIENGKLMLKEYAGLLNRLSTSYGIPSRYLVAFWGLETNFGRHKGKMEVLNGLATLACDTRRSEYFTQELFNLFTLLDEKRVEKSQLLGSWAGAMGHMQFMPTALKTYGIDGDGDGALNVWDSVPDALTSAANYLQQIGWNKEEIWGRTVEIPEGFDYSKVDFDTNYPLSHFKKLGITKTYNRPLPDYQTQAQLVLPAGHKGPAFLVYSNFAVFMKWNFSQNYALAVGLLADSLININNDVEDYSTKPYFFSPNDLKNLQQKLLDSGYEVGMPDGIWGPMTRKAIQQFQQKNKLIADGFPNPEVFEKLDAKLIEP